MRSLLGATLVATFLVACGQSQTSEQSESQLAAATDAKAPASETLGYTVSYLGASQQGTANFANGKVKLTIKSLPRGQAGLMTIELASGATKKYVGRVSALTITEKAANRKLYLSKATGAAAPKQSKSELEAGVQQRRAKYCGGGGFGGGFDDGRFGGGFDDDRFNGGLGDDRFKGGFDDRRFGNNGFDDRRFGNNGFDDRRFGNNGRLGQSTGGSAQQPVVPATQTAPEEGELILELVAPKG